MSGIQKRTSCPECGLPSKNLTEGYYCEHCGFFKKKEWKAMRRRDGIGWGWSIFGFACLIFLIMLFTSPLFENFGIKLFGDDIIAFGISIVAGAVAITAIFNFFMIRPDRDRPFLKTIRQLQSEWQSDRAGVAERIFATNQDNSVKISAIALLGNDYDRLKKIALSHKQEPIRFEAAKMIVRLEPSLDAAQKQDWNSIKLQVFDRFLVESKNPAIRLFVINQLSGDTERLRNIALNDPEVNIQVAAINQITERKILLELLQSVSARDALNAICGAVKLSDAEREQLIRGSYPLQLKDYLINQIKSKETVELLKRSVTDNETQELLGQRLGVLIDSEAMASFREVSKEGITLEIAIKYLEGDYSINLKKQILSAIDDPGLIIKLNSRLFSAEINQMVQSKVEKMDGAINKWLRGQYTRTLHEMQRLVITDKGVAAKIIGKNETQMLMKLHGLGMDDHIDSYRSKPNKVTKLVSTRSVIEEDGYHIQSKWMDIVRIGENLYDYSTWESDRLD